MRLSKNCFSCLVILFTGIFLFTAILSSNSQELATTWKKKIGFNSTDYSSLLIVNGKHFLSFNDGIYRSDDHGKHFARLEAFPLQKGQFLFLKLYRNGNEIYTFYKMGNGDCQLFTSVDYGETWQTYTVPQMQTVAFLVPEFRIYGNTWFIIDVSYNKSTCDYSFLYSTDNGSHWTVGNMGNYITQNTTNHLWLTEVTSAGNGYVGSAVNGIYYSSDLVTWQQINSSLKFILHQKNTSGADVIYAYSGTFGASIKRLDVNDNMHWADIFQGINLGANVAFAFYNDVAFASGDGGAYRSVDQGKTWQSVPLLNPDNKIVKLHICNDEYLSMTVQDVGLLRSTDGGISWTRSFEYNSIDKPFVNHYYKDGNRLLAYGLGGVYVIDGDHSYQILSKYIRSFTVRGNHYIAGTASGIYVSDDMGATWVKTAAYSALTLFASDEKTFMIEGSINNSGSPSKRYVSIDNGYTWALDQSIVPFNSIGYFANQDNTLFAIGNKRLRSTDNGQSWTVLSDLDYVGTPQGSIDIFGDKVFVSGPRGMVLSEDSGNTWTKVLDELSHYSTSVVKTGNHYFSTMNKKLVWSDDGRTWKNITGMPNDPMLINEFYIYLNGLGERNGKVYTSVNYYGDIWEVELAPPAKCQLISSETTGRKNERIEFPIKTRNLHETVGFQFSVEWDPAVVKYAGTTNLKLAGMNDDSFGITQTASGKLVIGWSSPNLTPVSPQDEQPIFSILFDLIGAPGSTTPVTITGPIEVVAKDFTLMEHEELTGSVSIQSNTTISGKISYRASPLHPSSVVILAQNGSPNFLVPSDDQGNYTQTVPAGADYELNPHKPSDPTTYLNYVNAADIAIYQRHITQTELLVNPYQLVAADLDTTHSVTIRDKILAEAVILGIQNFPNNKQWILIPANFSFALNDPYTYPTTVTLSDVIQDITQDFVAVHLADVVQTTNITSRLQAQSVMFDLSPQTLSEGQLRIEVRGKNFLDLSALQVAFMLTGGLELVRVEPVAIDPRSNVVGNSVRVIWTDGEGKSQTIAEDKVLFRLYLRESSASVLPLNERISLSNDFYAQAFSRDLRGSAINMEWTSTKSIDVDTEFGEWNPNPFSQRVSTTIILKQDQQVVVTIDDLTGTQVGKISFGCTKGVNEITFMPSELAGRELAAGTYLLSIIADGKIKTTKLVKE